MRRRDVRPRRPPYARPDPRRRGIIERFSLETELQQALTNDEFVLYYQPKFALPSGHVVGMEALLRWNHPRLGALTRKKFLSILEDTRLIVPVGEWVIRTACIQNKR